MKRKALLLLGLSWIALCLWLTLAALDNILLHDGMRAYAVAYPFVLFTCVVSIYTGVSVITRKRGMKE